MIRRFLALLSAAERRALARLVGLMALGGGLEALGPLLLALYLKPSPLLIEVLPPWMLRIVVAAPGGERSLSFPALIGAFYLAKIGYVLWLANRTNRFAFSLQTDVAARVLRSYLEMPFARFRDVGKGAVVRDVIGEPTQFTFNVTLPVLGLAAESLVLSALGVAALLISWQATITLVVILGVIGTGTQFLTRNVFRRLAEERRTAEQRRAQALENATGGWLEIRFARAAAAMAEGFRGAAYEGALREAWQQTLSQVPRQAFEVALLLSVLGMVIVRADASPEETARVAVALAAVGFRLLPSVTRIGGSLQLLRYGAPTLEHTAMLITEMEAQPPSPEPRPAPVGTVRVEGVSFRHSTDTPLVIDRLDFEFRRGELAAIVAPSGRGKTTLLHLMVGLLEPESGRILLDDEPVRERIAAGRAEIGYLGQHPAVVDASFWENMRLGCDVELRGDEVAALCDRLKLHTIAVALRRGEDPHLGSKGYHLSGGEKQRVALVRALARRPAILLLDEPTSGLDAESERSLLEVLHERRGDFVCVIVTHSPSVTEYCDRILAL